jgi:phospholipid/cholesterol/gamma-HCH transport system substrate-binding protein
VFNKKIEFVVGLFIIAGVLALLILAFRVSGITHWLPRKDTYILKAEFDNIGDLKVRAPVSVAGVQIGEVKSIELDHKNFRALVKFTITSREKDFPVDTSASILTQGLLGANYISLTPGFSDKLLKSNDTIQITRSAIILENLIGQLIYTKPTAAQNNESSKKTGE